MPKRLILFSAILFSLGQNFISYCFADNAVNGSITSSYRWGRGLNFPQRGLTFGGYTNVAYKNVHNRSDKVSLDDLSLFITWTPHARMRFFTELELEDLISTDGFAKSAQTFSVERLYVDVLATESFTVRFGKFLTPVGLWNVIHAAPLVWTTSRPLITDNHLFAAHANGLMVSSHFLLDEQDLEVSLYFDDSENLDPHPNPVVFENAFGGRVNYEITEQLSLGLSYLGFKNHATPSRSRNHLFGLDLYWKKNDYELQMELAYRHADDQQGDEKGLYLQGVAPLSHQLFAIGRYEYFAGTHLTGPLAANGGATHLGITGLAWRPFVPLVVKAEYRFGKGNEQMAPSGFFTSLSFFF